jgi:hypothetical protein
MNKLCSFLVILNVAGLLEVSANEVLVIKDMCPRLPDAIALDKPQYSDFVVVKPGNKKWTVQYEKFKQAKDNFNSKYNNEIKKTALEWEQLEAKENPSELRFNLLSTGIEDYELFIEIKSVCWDDVTSNDDYEKYNLCNPLDKPPSSKDWNKILLCTVERANTLKIKLL